MGDSHYEDAYDEYRTQFQIMDDAEFVDTLSAMAKSKWRPIARANAALDEAAHRIGLLAHV